MTSLSKDGERGRAVDSPSPSAPGSESVGSRSAECWITVRYDPACGEYRTEVDRLGEITTKSSEVAWDIAAEQIRSSLFPELRSIEGPR